MKKFLTGLLCGLLLATSTAVFASDTIQTVIMDAKFKFDGVVRELDDDNRIVLNYNGSAYVPVRFVAENAGKLVGYDAATQTISINSTPLNDKLIIDSEFKTYAAAGKLKGIDFGLGAKRSEVVAGWGDPHEQGTFQSVYESWFNYQYYFWNSGQSVGSIRVVGDSIDYDADFIRQTLGKPSSDGLSSATNNWTLYYEFGDYAVYFAADSEHGVVQSMLLKQK